MNGGSRHWNYPRRRESRTRYVRSTNVTITFGRNNDANRADDRPMRVTMGSFETISSLDSGDTLHKLQIINMGAGSVVRDFKCY